MARLIHDNIPLRSSRASAILYARPVANGVSVAPDITTGFTGTGQYRYWSGSVPDNAQYIEYRDQADNEMMAFSRIEDIAQESFTMSDRAVIQAIDAKITSRQIVVTQPVTKQGNFTLWRSFDFLAQNSQGIEFDISGAPNLDGAIVTLEKPDQTWILPGTVLVSSPTFGPQKVRFEFSRVLTQSFPVWTYELRMRAVLSNGSQVILLTPIMTVR